MERFTAVYEQESDESVSETVIRAVADARNEHPLEMEPRLYDAVDPEALDALFVSTATGGDGVADERTATAPATEPDDSVTSVSFSFGGRHVLVDSRGRVFLSDPTEASERVGSTERVSPVASAGSR